MRRLLIAGGAIAVAVVLFLVLRPDDVEDSTTPTAPAATGETTTGVEPTPPPPPTPPPQPALVRIEVEGGLPVGGPRRVTVSRGRRVILVVDADVADHVHLHGYDVVRDVGPGKQARLAFRATRLGTVEAELENSGVLIARITAQP